VPAKTLFAEAEPSIAVDHDAADHFRTARFRGDLSIGARGGNHMRALIIAAVLSLAVTGPVLADCYEDIGCTDSDVFSRSDLRQLSCENLWEVRNEIYYENGYCFQTDRAIDFFGNDECHVTNQSRVRLNSVERQNVQSIVAVERQKHCT
jgi:hypothetical protein